MSVEIGFAGLYIPLVGTAETDPDRAPLDELDDDERSHVHGTLWIRVNGHELPALGFWGPDDACLGSWVAELTRAVQALESSAHACYVYDEGEQGQPAFVFSRFAESLRISLEPSALGHGIAPHPWPDQTCAFADFVLEVRKFLDTLRNVVCSASPAGGEWFRAQLRDGAGSLRQ